MFFILIFHGRIWYCVPKNSVSFLSCMENAIFNEDKNESPDQTNDNVFSS